MHPASRPVRETRMRRQAVRVIRLSAGGVLLLVGVLGGFVPVFQGWLLVLAGLTVMAPESRRARSLLDWVRSRVRRAGTSGTVHDDHIGKKGT